MVVQREDKGRGNEGKKERKKCVEGKRGEKLWRKQQTERRRMKKRVRQKWREKNA